MTAAPPASLFPAQQWQQIEQLLRSIDERQALWLSGYLAAASQQAPGQAPAPQPRGKTVLIAHGGETDNSRSVALALGEQAAKAGIPAQVEDLAQLRVRQLAKHEHLLMICSTHGDGDPPEPVIPFFEALMADSAPALGHLQFSVLALGDSTYEHFCLTGHQLDQRLEALGATRIHPRQDCDVDYHEPSRLWGDAVLALLPKGEVAAPAQDALRQETAGRQFTKQNPLQTEVLENQCLSNSAREVPIHHIELALEAEDFSLSPGDAVGVLADNPPALIAAVLDATRLSGDAAVTVEGEPLPLVQALRQSLDLTIPSVRFLEFWAELSQADALRAVCASPPKEQRAFLKQVQVLELMADYPAAPEPQALVEALRPLQPRLYDVANSLNTVGDELHLNVKLWRYAFRDSLRTGIGSRYLLALEPGDTVRVYPHRNTRFHLPEEPATPVILIAEGTGIAPYRAFIQELALAPVPRPCWLVFAEHRFEEDFLYQLELQQAHQQGHLQHVDTVFYDDQPDATLATPLLAHAQRLLDWVERGAHVYFCGDKDRLTQCEDVVGEHIDRQLGSPRWQQYSKDKRIHRNLY